MHSIIDVARDLYPEMQVYNLDIVSDPELLERDINFWKEKNKPVLILACDNFDRHRTALEKIKNRYDKFAFTTPGFNNDRHHISNIDSLTAWCCDKSQPTVSHDQYKKYKFLFLVGNLHHHRFDLLVALAKKGLLDEMLMSLQNHAHAFPQLLPKKRSLPKEYEWPELSSLGDFDIWETNSKKNKAWLDKLGKVHVKRYEDTAFSIVSETNLLEGINYITEKTWIPIIAEHLFINHSNPGNNNFLETLGFRLDFDGISEYNENDHENIASVCKDLSNKDIKLLYECSLVKRRHNRNLALDESHWIDYHKKNLKNFFG